MRYASRVPVSRIHITTPAIGNAFDSGPALQSLAHVALGLVAPDRRGPVRAIDRYAVIGVVVARLDERSIRRTEWNSAALVVEASHLNAESGAPRAGSDFERISAADSVNVQSISARFRE